MSALPKPDDTLEIRPISDCPPISVTGKIAALPT